MTNNYHYTKKLNNTGKLLTNFKSLLCVHSVVDRKQ